MTFASQSGRRRRPKPAAHHGSRNAPGARWLASPLAGEFWEYNKDPNLEKIQPNNPNGPALAYPKKGRGQIFCWHVGGHYWYTHKDAKL